MLNEIIAHGGTTALEQPFTPAALKEAMLTGPGVYCCFVAEDAAGSLVGFQALTRSDHVPDGVGDIGTFARVQHVQKGTGSRLFAATRQAAGKGASRPSTPPSALTRPAASLSTAGKASLMTRSTVPCR